MKVKAEKTFFHRSRQINKGEVFEVDSSEGQKLVSYSVVKEEKTKRKTKEEKAQLKTK